MSSDIKFSQKYNDTTFREEIDVTFPKERFQTLFDKALVVYKKSATAPGFRKGNVPENVVLGKYLQEINNQALSYAIEESVKSFGELTPRPAEPLNVEKIEQGEDGDLKMMMSYYPMPVVELGDYSSLKVSKKEPKKATPEELEKELENIWFHYVKNIDATAKKEDYSVDKINSEFLEKSGLKNVYKDVNNAEDLKKQIESYINSTYEQNSVIEWESDLQDQIIEKSKFTKTEGLVEKELNNRVADYKARFAQIGMDPEKYIQENNVNLDELRAEWKPSAEKYVKLELALQKYGEENKFIPTEEEVDAELSLLDENVKKRYKDNPENLRSLIRYYYVNQKSFQDLTQKAMENSDLSEKTDDKKAAKPKKEKK